MPDLIYGFAGKKRAGKDHVAKVWGGMLSRDFNLSVEYCAFAHPIISTLCNIGLLHRHLWENSPEYKRDSRKLVQETGEFFKRFEPNIWVDYAARRYDASIADVFIVTDVRFTIESAWIHALDGLVIEVTSDLEDSHEFDLDPHVSEIGLPSSSVDASFVNYRTGDLEGWLAKSDQYRRLEESYGANNHSN